MSRKAAQHEEGIEEAQVEANIKYSGPKPRLKQDQAKSMSMS